MLHILVWESASVTTNTSVIFTARMCLSSSQPGPLSAGEFSTRSILNHTYRLNQHTCSYLEFLEEVSFIVSAIIQVASRNPGDLTGSVMQQCEDKTNRFQQLETLNRIELRPADVFVSGCRSITQAGSVRSEGRVRGEGKGGKKGVKGRRNGWRGGEEVERRE